MPEGLSLTIRMLIWFPVIHFYVHCLFHMCPSLSTLHFPDVVEQCILSLLLSKNNSKLELFYLQLQGCLGT